jgi:hypothetical protein
VSFAPADTTTLFGFRNKESRNSRKGGVFSFPWTFGHTDFPLSAMTFVTPMV